MAMQLKLGNSDIVVRRTANYSPSIWGDRFLSVSVDTKVVESYDEQIKMLKETVKKMLIASTSDTLENVRFIDLLCCLGVSYHFQAEIEQQLANAFEDYAKLIDNIAAFDLYTVALFFRVFRQHGHLLPSDVFEKFRDSDGKFKEALTGDAKGMLSLYEASQLAMNGEKILDDALSFTKAHLKSLAAQSSHHLAQFITSSLYRPLYKCLPRLAARQFISFYGEEETKNETLLKFAKIDFNRLQLLYQEELCQLTRWHRSLDITSKLPYARDRLVEIYTAWGAGFNFEPQFSKTRIILSKAVEMMSVIDDTYDAYGTIEELRIFTSAIQRMDLNVVDELPDYMKYLYRIFLNLFDEWSEELAEEGLSSDTSYARDGFTELVRAYHLEAEWLNKGYVPTVEEYMSNALITSGYIAIPMFGLLSMGNFAGPPVCEWLKALPKIIVGAQAINCLVSDIVSHEDEQKRGHVASFIECYMKQYGVSEEEAVKACDKRTVDAWKDINEDFMMQQTSLSITVLTGVVNLAGAIEVAYRYDNGYVNPEKSLKPHIESLFLQPIPM